MADVKMGTSNIATRELDGSESAANEPNPSEVESKPPSRPLWRRVAGVFWDSFDGEPRERRYIQKLDAYLL